MAEQLGTAMNPRNLRLHYQGSSPEAHAVPWDILSRSMNEIQKMIFLLARAQKGERLGQRVRPSDSERERFGLVCRFIEEGGFVMPATIGSAAQPTMFDDDDSDDRVSTGRIFWQITEAIARSDRQDFERLLPDTSYQGQVLTAFRNALPPIGSPHTLSLESDSAELQFSSPMLAQCISEFSLPPTTIDDDRQFITGELVRMSFDRRRLRISLPGGLSVEATYADEFEPTLLAHPRDLVQLHGSPKYGNNQQIKSISEVDEVTVIDESRIEIHHFISEGKRLAVEDPLIFDVTFDLAAQAYLLTGEFGITCIAETRLELEEVLEETLEMYWQEFALEATDKLTTKANDLKEEMLGRVKVQHNGT